MELHFKKFKDFYFEEIGTLEKNWKVIDTIWEKTQARTQDEEDSIAEAPKQNRLCCLKLKPEESEAEIKWHIVQQLWDEGESDLAHETHKVGEAKKTWEMCGSYSAFSYHMHLSRHYELACRGVSEEHANDSDSDSEEEGVSEHRQKFEECVSDIVELRAALAKVGSKPEFEGWVSEPPESAADSRHGVLYFNGIMTEETTRKMAKRKPHKQDRATVQDPISASSNSHRIKTRVF